MFGLFIFLGVWFIFNSTNVCIFRENDKANLFTDDNRYSQVAQVKGEISSIEQELKDYRKEIRLALRQPSLEYTTVLQTEVNQEKGGWAALHVCLLQRYGLYFIKGKQKLFISIKENGSCLFP